MVIHCCNLMILMEKREIYWDFNVGDRNLNLIMHQM